MPTVSVQAESGLRPPSAGELCAMVDQLENRSGALHDMVDALESRLSPVTRALAGLGQPEEEEHECCTVMGGRIQKCNKSLLHVSYRLKNLLESLEV